MQIQKVQPADRGTGFRPPQGALKGDKHVCRCGTLKSHLNLIPDGRNCVLA